MRDGVCGVRGVSVHSGRVHSTAQAAQARPGAGRPLNRTPATGRRSECVALSSGLSWALCATAARTLDRLRDYSVQTMTYLLLQKVFGPRSVIRPVRRSRCLVFSFSTARSQVQSNAVPRVQTVCWCNVQRTRKARRDACSLFVVFIKKMNTRTRAPRRARAHARRALAAT